MKEEGGGRLQTEVPLFVSAHLLGLLWSGGKKCIIVILFCTCPENKMHYAFSAGPLIDAAGICIHQQFDSCHTASQN